MDLLMKSIDRRHYETRGVVIKEPAVGRGISDELRHQLQRQFIKKYGEGWELDSIHPGSIAENDLTDDWSEGHLLVFKRRRQLRDE